MNIAKKNPVNLYDVDKKSTLDEDQRNWRGFIIALFVIIIMCSMIVVAVLLLTPLTDGRGYSGRPISLEDVVENKLSVKHDNSAWISCSQFTFIWQKQLLLIDTSTFPATNQTIMGLRELIHFQSRFGIITSLRASSSGNYIAVAHAKQKMKHAIENSYAFRVLASKSNKIEPIGPKKTGDEMLQLFQWNPAPNATDFVFVYNNNIWYQSSPEDDFPIQITSTNNTLIYNGITDWLYEEEIFDSNVALWWSPDGEYLAFATFDDMQVETIKFPIYKGQYPTIREVPYPKTGVEHLPKVNLSIWRKKDRTTKVLRFPPMENTSEHQYLFRVSWIKGKISNNSNGLLTAIWANRPQNATYIMLCSYDVGECKQNYKQVYIIDKHRLWAEPEEYTIEFSSESTYFVILPQRGSNGNIYSHVAKVSISPVTIENASAVFLSSGNYDVTKIVGFDEKRNEIYYMAASPRPSERRLFVVNTNSTDDENQPRCLTCCNKSFPNCSFQKAKFSSDGQHLLFSCLGPGIPTTKLVKIVQPNENISDSYLKPLMTIIDNMELAINLAQIAMPVIRKEIYKLDNGYEAIVKLLLPPGFDDVSNDQRYPLILSVYAGPNTQSVNDDQIDIYDAFLASNKRYIIAHIDGRGSGFRGWKYKEPIYRKIIAKHNYVDETRIAVWGWSYGGFATGHIIEQEGYNIFKCAASVAPVTNFRYYDTAYTERYMGLLDETSELAYNRTDLTRNVIAFSRIKYLLVHGTGDDNVHFQNAAMLTKSLIEKNIQFKLMIYPNKKHGLYLDRLHLYTLLNRFFEDCFTQPISTKKMDKTKTKT